MYKDLFQHQIQFKVEPIVYSQMKCLVYSTCGEGTSTSYLNINLRSESSYQNTTILNVEKLIPA